MNIEETERNLIDIIKYVREKGFDLNEEIVICDVGNGIEMFTGVVLTYEKRIVVKNKFVPKEQREGASE